MYTDIPSSTPVHTFTIGADQCGQYNEEGDCYNHEHVWPKTYYNDASPMNTDLHHIIPTDGWANNKRGNFPYGHVSGSGWTGSNGSKTGSTSDYAGYTGNAFEPIDEYKGDIARMYFYTSTRYLGQDGSWQSWEMASGAELTQDAIQLLLLWHTNDPVSSKEVDRNNAIYNIQGNRNPFVDYPVFADCIWGNVDCTPLNINAIKKSEFKIYPNPVTDEVQLLIPSNEKIVEVNIYDMLGKAVIRSTSGILSTSNLPNGIYTIRLQTNASLYTSPFIKQ